MNGDNMSDTVKTLLDTVYHEKKMTPGKARLLIDEAAIEADTLLPWASFDHPKADSYGRKTVYDGGFFRLMVMSWVEGDMSSIHDHGDTQWGAVQVFGSTENAVFKKEERMISTVERSVLAPGSIVAIGHNLMHQMGNTGSVPFLSLHLYGCYESEGDMNADASIYDLDEGVIKFCNRGAFFDLPEALIHRRQAGITADFPTLLRYKVELLRRLCCKHESDERQSFNKEREQRLLEELFSKKLWQLLEKELVEINNASPSHKRRYFKSLGQELFALANYQIELANSNKAPDTFYHLKEEINRLLKNHENTRFAACYLQLLSHVYNMTFNMTF